MNDGLGNFVCESAFPNNNSTQAIAFADLDSDGVWTRGAIVKPRDLEEAGEW